MTVLKRNNRSKEDNGALALANCLMLLSRVGQSTGPAGNKLFTCKTCDRQFPSFQALGGHRASHKKPRLIGDPNDRSPVKKQSRAHECSVCGQEFAIGQALGGHMRRHRAVEKVDDVAMKPVMMKRSGSGSKRVVLSLDLNLTPFENDVKYSVESALPSWLNLGIVN